jgi:hypothetical protein
VRTDGINRHGRLEYVDIGNWKKGGNERGITIGRNGK